MKLIKLIFIFSCFVLFGCNQKDEQCYLKYQIAANKNYKAEDIQKYIISDLKFRLSHEDITFVENSTEEFCTNYHYTVFKINIKNKVYMVRVAFIPKEFLCHLDYYDIEIVEMKE